MMNVHAYTIHAISLCAKWIVIFSPVAVSLLSNKKFAVVENYALNNTPIADIVLTDIMLSKMKCFTRYHQINQCKSVSMKKDLSRCRLYDVSIAATGSVPVTSEDWDTYTSANDWHPIVKYSAGNSQYNSLNMADFYSTDAYAASFPEDICGVDPAEKCSRPYKHTLQKELLANVDVKEIKIGVYKDGTEVAWAAFTKNLGVDDVWFHPSRVVDSHPWDKNQLRESTANFQTLISNYHGSLFWTMSEGSKYNTEGEDRLTAHARWVTMGTANECDSIAGTTSDPVILYSKQAGPTYLAARDIGYVHKIHGQPYDTLGTEAAGLCGNYLHTEISTYDNVSIENSNKDYSCCAAGWMASGSGYWGGYPMTIVEPLCGNTVGMVFWTSDLAVPIGVYCKRDSSAVGEADTLVISVKF